MIARLLRRLRRDERGVAVIELAMAAPVLALLVMGAADVGAAFSRKLALEQGAQRAVEKIMQTTQLKTVEGTITKEVSDQAGVPESQVSVTFPRYCGTRLMVDPAIDEYGFSDGAPCNTGEQEAHYVMVYVHDEYSPLFPALGMGKKLADGKYLVQAKAGMRTK